MVYSIAFNNPFGDRIATGSFDRTAKIWDANTGQCLYTLRGHQSEIVCLNFDSNGYLFATGSMDHSACLWDVETGQQICSFKGHTGEIVSIQFNTDGDKVLTGSFDYTSRI